MEYILISIVILACFVVNYLWKKLTKDSVEVKNEGEPVAPYKVEPPVEPPVKTVTPELKVVTGSDSKSKNTKRPVKPKLTHSVDTNAGTKTPSKVPAKVPAKVPTKASTKTRTKKPTDNV